MTTESQDSAKCEVVILYARVQECEVSEGKSRAHLLHLVAEETVPKLAILRTVLSKKPGKSVTITMAPVE